jgi:hypothetical protein
VISLLGSWWHSYLRKRSQLSFNQQLPLLMTSPNDGHDEFKHQVAIKLSRALNTLNPNDLLAQRVIDIAKTNSTEGFIAGAHVHPFVYFQIIIYEFFQRLRLLASLKIYSCRSSMQKSCCMQSRKLQVSRLIRLKGSQ